SGGGTFPGRKLVDRARDRSERASFGGLHDHGVARVIAGWCWQIRCRAWLGSGGRSRAVECQLGDQKGIGAANRRELDADKRAVRPGTHVSASISGSRTSVGGV